MTKVHSSDARIDLPEGANETMLMVHEPSSHYSVCCVKAGYTYANNYTVVSYNLWRDWYDSWMFRGNKKVETTPKPVSAFPTKESAQIYADNMNARMFNKPTDQFPNKTHMDSLATELREALGVETEIGMTTNNTLNIPSIVVRFVIDYIKELQATNENAEKIITNQASKISSLEFRLAGLE